MALCDENSSVMEGVGVVGCVCVCVVVVVGGGGGG